MNGIASWCTPESADSLKLSETGLRGVHNCFVRQQLALDHQKQREAYMRLTLNCVS